MKSTRYCIVDKSKTITLQAQYKNSKDAFHELLNCIDNSLNVLLNVGIQIDTKTLNFDNYECVECSFDQHITNVFRFNLDGLYFYDTHQNKYVITENKRFKFILDNIRTKLGRLNSTSSDKQVLNTNTASLRVNKLKSDNPIKHILSDVKDPLKKVNDTKQPDLVRKIPTVKLEDDSIYKSDSEDNDQSSDEDSEKIIIASTKTIDTSKLILPNIERPMNSTIGEKAKSKLNINILDNDNDIDSDIDLEELKKTQEELLKLKAQETEKLEQLKTATEQDMNNLSNFCTELCDIKREARRDKEREKERRKKFEGNKYAYSKMQQDIKSGKLIEDKIGEFFKDYPIYKFMDQKQLLNKPDDYIVYLNLYNELFSEKNNNDNHDSTDKEYVPHNVNYLSKEDQEKYKSINSDNKDLIDTFMKDTVKNKPTKQFPSLDAVLTSIDNTNDIDIGIDTNNITFEKGEPRKKLNIMETVLKNKLNDD